MEKVDFIYNKPIYKDEILNILKTILTSRGLQLVQSNDVLNIVALDHHFEIKVVYLKNTKAADILPILQNLKTASEKLQFDTMHIALFEDTNAIVLKGIASKVEQFTKIIEQLDIEKKQVYVQARIIEVNERKTQNIGIEYGIEGFNTNSSGIMTFSSSLNALTEDSSLNLNELSSYGYNPNNIKSALSLGATINLLKQNEALDIVSEPSILCINNQESSIYVGETRSIPTGTTIGTTTTTSFQREDIGLKLIVTPRISDTNKVTLQLRTVLEDIKETDVITGNPNTNKKEVVTTVIVNNGESVILGGLIKNKIEKNQDKIPFLGDIPYVGTVFRNSYDINDKINLIVIVTPYIIPKSKDLTFVLNQLTDLKILEQKYTKVLVDNLEKNKIETQNKEKTIDIQTQNQKKHNQRMEEIFGL